MVKLPAFQFYPGDWLKDPAVRSVSLAARGLWIDMLCLMHESPRRGYLQHANGKPVTAEQLARMTGCSTDEVSRLLQELENAGVFSCTEHGVIYSRRMIRDEHIRQVRREAGKKGIESRLLKQNSSKTDLLKQNSSKPSANLQQTGQQNARSSSSSSFSSSTSSNSSPLERSPPLLQQTPLDEQQSPDGDSSPNGDDARVDPDRDAFEEWWRHYPRKVGKQAAFRAYVNARKRICKERKCAPSEARSLLLQACIAFSQSPKARSEFCPHPGTWLNQGRYDDDPAEWDRVSNEQAAESLEEVLRKAMSDG